MKPDTTAPQVHGLFDPATWTVTYVVHNGPGTACAIIDPVLDYDPKAGRTGHASADRVIAYVRAQNLQVEWILETHAHADHLSAAPYIKAQLGGQIAIGDHITAVQKVFKGIFNLEPGFKLDGSQFDHLFKDDEQFQVGELSGRILYVPGHTPACVAYQFGDGFSNMIVPTNIVLMSILGIAGIPYDRWLRFIWPLLLKLTLAAAVALVVAVQIGYH